MSRNHNLSKPPKSFRTRADAAYPNVTFSWPLVCVFISKLSIKFIIQISTCLRVNGLLTGEMWKQYAHTRIVPGNGDIWSFYLWGSHLSVTLTLLDRALSGWRKQLDPCLATNHLWVFISIAEEFTLQITYFPVKGGLQTSGSVVLEWRSANGHSWWELPLCHPIYS